MKKKILGVLAGIVIIWIMSAISFAIGIAVDVSREENINTLSQPAYVFLGLLKLLPLAIGIWLVKLSWKKITTVKEKEK